MKPFARLSFVAFLLGLLTMALACAPAGSGPGGAGAPDEPDEPLTIRVVHGVPISTLIAQMKEVGETMDVLENYGTDYVIENTRIDASSEVANVMAAGEADIGFTATGPIINANTKLGADLRIVADVVQGGREGHEGLWFVVLEDSEVQEIADLEGKTLASLGFGTFSDLAMRAGLVKAGLDPERDVTIVQVPFPAMEANLREEKVDMAQLVQPFKQNADRQGGLRVLYTATDGVGETQTLFLAIREAFAEENPRRVQAFFDDLYRFNQWALDPANREEVIRIGATMMDLPPDPANFAYFGTKDDWYRSKDGRVNVEAIVREMNNLVEFGVVDTTVDIEEWVDMSWIDRAEENVTGGN